MINSMPIHFTLCALVLANICSDGVLAFAPNSATTLGMKPKVLKMADGESEAISLVPGETALVMIEYQNEFTTEGGALHDAVKDCMEKTGTIENSKKVMDAARSAGCQIIHAPIMFDKVRTRNIMLMPITLQSCDIRSYSPKLSYDISFVFIKSIYNLVRLSCMMFHSYLSNQSVIQSDYQVKLQWFLIL